MRQDGFLWTSSELTAKAIKRQVLREMISVVFGRRRAVPPAGAADPIDPQPPIPSPSAEPETRETVA